MSREGKMRAIFITARYISGAEDGVEKTVGGLMSCQITNVDLRHNKDGSMNKSFTYSWFVNSIEPRSRLGHNLVM